MKVCEFCGFTTNNGKIMSNHKRWNHVDWDRQIYKKKISEKCNQRYGITFKTVKIKCKECGKLYETEIKLEHGVEKERFTSKSASKYKKEFCSKSCANKQGHKYLSNEGIKKRNNIWRKNIRWLNESGNVLGNNRKRYFSSKREREILSYLKTNHEDDYWTSGYFCKHNDLRINVDAYSKKLNIVFEYDGVWHFKDIFGQLERKKELIFL